MEVLSRTACAFTARTETWLVRPASVAQVFRITVTAPQNRTPSHTAPQGVLVLDGDLNAGLAVSTVNGMAISGETPPSVVVSVGYPLDAPASWIALRNRDFTPTAFPELATYLEDLLGEPIPGTGGADAFMSFLTAELKPAVEAAFGVPPGAWTLVGQSFGGLFSIHALLSDPRQFRRYLVVSPALWWKRPYLQDRARTFAKEPAPALVDLFLGVGELEGGAHLAAQAAGLSPALAATYDRLFGGLPDFVADLEAFARLLAPRAGLRLTTKILMNESHNSVMGPALSQGLRWLNDPARGAP